MGEYKSAEDKIDSQTMERDNLKEEISSLKIKNANKEFHIFFKLIEVFFGFLSGFALSLLELNFISGDTSNIGIILLVVSAVFLITAFILEGLIRNK